MVKVMIFASYREVAGTDSISVELPERSAWTIRELRRSIAEQFQSLSGRMSSTLFAVNEIMVRDDDEFGPDDNLAAMPPVSGG